MKIVILKKFEYRGCPAVLTQFLTSFQYYFEAGNELYMDHFTMRPGWARWISWKLGLMDYPFTPQQIKDAEDILMDGVVKSIDIMFDPEKLEKMQQARLHRKRGGKHSDCVWQTRGDKYWCLKHEKEAPMTDGDYPFHKDD